MELKWTGHYHGPSPWARSPVLVAEICVNQRLEGSRLAVAQRQLWTVSGMSQPQSSSADACSHDDVALALARTASEWSLACLNEVRGYLHDGGALRAGDCVQLWLGYHHPHVSRMALELAWRLLNLSLQGQDITQARTDINRLWQACRTHHPDYQSRILMAGARRNNVPYLSFLPNTKFWQFGWGARSRVFFETGSNADGAMGWQWQRNKVLCKQWMQSLGMPTPQHVLVSHKQELPAAAHQIGYPCVIKPMDGSSGKGVTANIQHLDQLHKAFDHARQFSQSPLMLEAHASGYDHRLMVVNGQLIAAVSREASYLIGDGVSTVQTLLNGLNSQRSDNMIKSGYLRPIAIDHILLDQLQQQALDLDTVPASGRKVHLRSNANLSTGGVCTDRTDCIHPQVRAMAEQMAVCSGMATLGIDYLTLDISLSPQDSQGVFIEMNAVPSMDVLVAAGHNEDHIAHIVLGDVPARIPVTLHVCSNEQLQQLQLQLQNQTLPAHEAWVCDSTLHVGQALLTIHNEQPWDAVHAALRNRRVETLHVFCTAQAIEEQGLPLDGLAEVDLQVTDLPTAWRQVLQAATHKPRP